MGQRYMYGVMISCSHIDRCFRSRPDLPFLAAFKYRLLRTLLNNLVSPHHNIGVYMAQKLARDSPRPGNHTAEVHSANKEDLNMQGASNTTVRHAQTLLASSPQGNKPLTQQCSRYFSKLQYSTAKIGSGSCFPEMLAKTSASLQPATGVCQWPHQ